MRKHKERPKKKVRKRFGLVVVISVAIILITLAVTIAVSVINYQKYRAALMTAHQTASTGAGKMIEASLTPEEWSHLSEMGNDYLWGNVEDEEMFAETAMPEFEQACKVIQATTDALDLFNVSVFTIDQEEMNRITGEDFDVDQSNYMVFLMDFYQSSDDIETYVIGDMAIWWEDYSGYEDYRDVFNTVIESREPVIIEEVETNGTTLLTVYYPICADGEFQVMAMVSLRVKDIDSFVNSFFVPTLLIGLGIAAALILVAIVFFMWRIVRPLRIITHEADQFVTGEPKVSERLPKVRTRDEIQQLAESFLQMEEDVQRYIGEVASVTAEKEHIRTELNVAARIQEDMLPRVFPPYPDRKEFSVYASMDPAKEVGGDFYDFFFIDQDHFALVMADVSGKGVPASLFMVIAKTLIKTRAMQGGTPAEILRDVNINLCDCNDESMFVTVWFAIIDLRTGKGVSVNAGHEHPIRCDANSDYHLVEYRHSPAVALFDTLKFREREFELHPGDKIFVYTDGLPEATNASDELYGTERVLRVLNAAKDAQLDDLLPLVTQDVARFVGDAPQFDDLTMLLFAYHGPSEN